MSKPEETNFFSWFKELSVFQLIAFACFVLGKMTGMASMLFFFVVLTDKSFTNTLIGMVSVYGGLIFLSIVFSLLDFFSHNKTLESAYKRAINDPEFRERILKEMKIPLDKKVQMT